MFDPQQYLRAHIMKMSPYTPILPLEVLSTKLGVPVAQIVKLDANENPYGPISEVAAALANLAFAHIYPDPESRLLRQAITNFTGVPFGNILAGAGADELIDLIMRLLLEAGDSILDCPPTFGMYQFDAEVNGAQVISVYRKANFALDLDRIRKAVEKYQPKIIFLASPNNPDGSLLPAEQINALLDLPIIVVLDEAYIDFAHSKPSWIGEVENRENLVVLRTFSKWPGLAGLRVGYGVFPDWMMPHLWKIKQPYNVSVAASTAAIISLENVEKLEDRTEKIVSEREQLFQILSTITWLAPYPSQANFILCRVIGRDAAQVKSNLAKQGILIRYFNKPGLQDHIRISVGRPEDTKRLELALRAM
jgi:histidinol-phosphate aminotransferase